MNKTNCPICNSPNNELLIKSKDYFILNGKSEDFFVYFCKDCQNGFSYPFLSNEELSKYYPDDYDCYKSHKSITGLIQKIKAGKDVRIIKKILKNKGKDLLEIGAGSGLFLSLLKKASLNVSGIEMSSSGVKYAKETFDIDLEKCFFEDYNSSNQFDMIVAFHVLEHFNDPASVLDKIKPLLKDGGYLYFKVPRLDSWPARRYGRFWHGYDLPRHRFHFTEKGLIDLFKKEGFEIVMSKSDYGPLDTIRAIDYFSKFSNNKPAKYLFQTVNTLPYIVKFFAATLVETIMSPFKSGRMSVIARKIKK